MLTIIKIPKEQEHMKLLSSRVLLLSTITGFYEFGQLDTCALTVNLS